MGKIVGIAVIGRPEAYVVFRDKPIDEAGNVTDEALRKVLAAYVNALVNWIARVNVT